MEEEINRFDSIRDGKVNRSRNRGPWATPILLEFVSFHPALHQFLNRK